MLWGTHGTTGKTVVNLRGPEHEADPNDESNTTTAAQHGRSIKVADVVA